jgi:hypothetical protein
LNEEFESIAIGKIRQMIEGFAKIIDAPQNLLPTFSNPDGAKSNVDIDPYGKLFYETYDRGKQIKKINASNEDDLCYYVFDPITFSMACIFELQHRVESQDMRRIIFDKQEELLGQMKGNWKIRKHDEHQSILKSRPFDDFSQIRLEYHLHLVKSGMTQSDARIEARKKYPLPVPKGEE